MLLLLMSCGLRPCEDLCEARADCIEVELKEQGSTWQVWTGFAGRQAYVDDCVQQFERSKDQSGEGGELRRLCRREQEGDVCP